MEWVLANLAFASLCICVVFIVIYIFVLKDRVFRGKDHIEMLYGYATIAVNSLQEVVDDYKKAGTWNRDTANSVLNKAIDLVLRLSKGVADSKDKPGLIQAIIEAVIHRKKTEEKQAQALEAVVSSNSDVKKKA